MFVIVLIALSPIVVFIPHLSRYFSLAEESFKVFTVRCISLHSHSLRAHLNPCPQAWRWWGGWMSPVRSGVSWALRFLGACFAEVISTYFRITTFELGWPGWSSCNMAHGAWRNTRCNFLCSFWFLSLSLSLPLCVSPSWYTHTYKWHM